MHDEHWDFIEQLLPVLGKYKRAIEILESDQFGTISLVLRTFGKIKKHIMKLDPIIFSDNISSFISEYDDLMNEYKNQMHPINDAATILNLFINNEYVNIDEGIQYIENQ